MRSVLWKLLVLRERISSRARYINITFSLSLRFSYYLRRNGLNCVSIDVFILYRKIYQSGRKSNRFWSIWWMNSFRSFSFLFLSAMKERTRWFGVFFEFAIFGGFISRESIGAFEPTKVIKTWNAVLQGEKEETHLEGLPQREIGKENVLLLHVADSSAPSFCQPFTIQPDFTPVQAHAARQAVQ